MRRSRSVRVPKRRSVCLSTNCSLVMVGRIFRGFVFDEITEARVVAVADGGLHGNGLLGHLRMALTRSTESCISSAISSGVASRPNSWRSCFCARMSLPMIVMCTGCGWWRLVRDARVMPANPPRGVKWRIYSRGDTRIFHTLHQPHVAFLDDVQERLAAVGVFLAMEITRRRLASAISSWPGAPWRRRGSTARRL